MIFILLLLALICFLIAAVKGDSQFGYLGLFFWVATELIKVGFPK